MRHLYKNEPSGPTTPIVLIVSKYTLFLQSQKTTTFKKIMYFFCYLFPNIIQSLFLHSLGDKITDLNYHFGYTDYNNETKGAVNMLLNKSKIYDTLIIGGGPAGYGAALYTSRSGLETLVVEKLSAGGQIALSHWVDNYPGFEDGIDGFSLGMKMQKSAERFGTETVQAEVKKVSLDKPVKEIETTAGTFFARTVMIASGANPKELGLPNEKNLTGRGVHYCAACDGMFYRGKTVVVVGGGNSAVSDALLLSRLCQKVILVHRGDKLKASKVYLEPIMNNEKIEVKFNSLIKEIKTDGKITGIITESRVDGSFEEISCDGIFISIGRYPSSELFKEQIKTDESGYIVADESTRTNLPGVFAIGDIRTKALRQVVTAISDGATASLYAEEYLAETNK